MRYLVTAAILLFVTLAGCAQRPVADGSSAAASMPPPAFDARAVPVFHGSSGTPATWDELVHAVAIADVAIIGELHGHERGLPAAAALWADALEQTYGGDPALSLEFFDRDEQAFIDDYLLGVIDEETFREETGRTESSYPTGHRAMVEAAKDAGARVFAANAPRRYTTLARTEGFDAVRALRDSQRRLVVLPDPLPTGEYRERFDAQMSEMMSSHGGETGEDAQRAMIDGLFRAQSTWDATMADTIARALSEGCKPVVQVVGRFHVDRDGGLVQALRELRLGANVVTISVADAPALSDEDLGRADFVLAVGE